MAGSDRLSEDLRQALAPLGAVTVRRMFSGAGLFFDGLMFALIIDEVLYLKADAMTQPGFAAEGLQPFTYERKTGTRTVMSYWQAPDRLLDEPEEMLEWASQAIAVARRKANDAPAKRVVAAKPSDR